MTHNFLLAESTDPVEDQTYQFIDSNPPLLRALYLLKMVVGSTLGCNGYNVSLNTQTGIAMRITKDGATVAERCHDSDAEVSPYLKTISEVAKSVDTEVGDGTTTVTVMACTLLPDLIELVRDNHHPRKIINDMNPLFDLMKVKSKELSQKLTPERIRDIAWVSTNHDEAMTTIVCNIVEGIGPFGRFICNTGVADRDIVSISRGYTIDTGVYHDRLLPNPTGSSTVNTFIVAINGELTLELAQGYIEKNCDIVLLCDSINESDSIRIAQLIYDSNSKRPGTSRIYPVELSGTPFIREGQKADIMSLASTDGTCSVTLERNKTTFHFQQCARIDAYIREVANNEVGISSGFDLEIHKDRVQRLRGGFATIMASGSTPTETKERRDRINDAVLACQSALREGYVIGGGNHYLMIGSKILNAVPPYLVPAVTNYLKAVFEGIHVNSGVSEKNIASMLIYFDATGETVVEDIDFSVTGMKQYKVEDYPILDSAGTPVRVFEATRSLMNTLLPIKHQVTFNGSKFS